jgi:hypothetical protein
MNNSEEKDDLWQLMGRANKPVASPFFARNVLREIRLAEEKRRTGFFGFFAWLRAHARIVSLGGIAAILVAGNGVSIMHPDMFVSAPAAPKETVATAANGKDYEVINHLDELLAYEENSIWLDDSAK